MLTNYMGCRSGRAHVMVNAESIIMPLQLLSDAPISDFGLLLHFADVHDMTFRRSWSHVVQCIVTWCGGGMFIEEDAMWETAFAARGYFRYSR
jgi:hypothetical protein